MIIAVVGACARRAVCTRPSWKAHAVPIDLVAMTATAPKRTITASITFFAVTYTVLACAVICAVVQAVARVTRWPRPTRTALACSINAVATRGAVFWALDLLLVTCCALPAGVAPTRSQDALAMLCAMLVTLRDGAVVVCPAGLAVASAFFALAVTAAASGAVPPHHLLAA